MFYICGVCGRLVSDQWQHTHIKDKRFKPKPNKLIMKDGNRCGRCGTRLLNDAGSLFCINCGHVGY